MVWGDGTKTFSRAFDLSDTAQFGNATFDWRAETGNWKWARIEIWDIAGNGALTNAVYR